MATLTDTVQGVFHIVQGVFHNICQGISAYLAPMHCEIIFLWIYRHRELLTMGILLCLELAGCALDFASSKFPHLTTPSFIISAVVVGILVRRLRSMRRNEITMEDWTQMTISFLLLSYSGIVIYFKYEWNTKFSVPLSTMPALSSILMFIFHFVKRRPTHIQCEGQVYGLTDLPTVIIPAPDDELREILVAICACASQHQHQAPIESQETPQSSTSYRSALAQSQGIEELQTRPAESQASIQTQEATESQE